MPELSADTRTNRVDPRVLRTRALLKKAALELAAEHEPDTITLAHIAERATVNRATVYQHYRDREELLLDAMEDELTGLVRVAAACPLVLPPREMPSALTDVFRHIETHATLYRRLLGPCGSARFANRLRQLFADEVAEQMEAAGTGRRDDPTVTLRAHHTAGALVGLITHWLTRPEVLPAEEVAAVAWGAIRRDR